MGRADRKRGGQSKMKCGYKNGYKYKKEIDKLWDKMNAVVRTKLRPRTRRAVDELQEIVDKHDALLDEEFKGCTDFYQTALFNLGCAYEHAGKLEKSIELHQEAIKMNPNDDEALYTAGTNLVKLGKDEEAEELLRRAVQLKPGRADYRQNLADVLQPRYRR